MAKKNTEPTEGEQQTKSPQQPAKERKANKNTLIVGSSITRDLISTDKTTVVTSISGGTIENVAETCRNTSHTCNYVVLAVGGNDCSRNKNIDELLHQYKELIDAARDVTCGGTVKVSSVCPRQDNVYLNHCGSTQLVKNLKIEAIVNLKSYAESTSSSRRNNTCGTAKEERCHRYLIPTKRNIIQITPDVTPSNKTLECSREMAAQKHHAQASHVLIDKSVLIAPTVTSVVRTTAPETAHTVAE